MRHHCIRQSSQEFVINIVKKRKIDILPHSDQRPFIYKNSLLGFKKTDHPIKNWNMELNRVTER